MGSKKKGQYETMAEEALDKGEVKDMIPEFVKWEPGQKLIGRYSHSAMLEGKREGTSETQEYNMYFFDTDKGMVKFHLGAYNDGEIGQQFVEGQIYMIEFVGQVDVAGGNRVNKFKCMHIYPRVAPVQG